MSDPADQPGDLAADVLGRAYRGAQRYLIDDIIAPDQAADLETAWTPTPRAFRLSARRRFQRLAHRDNLADLVPAPPAAGEQIHLVSASKFDFWTWAPAMLDWLGTADTLYCSTWTMSRPNAVELLELIDSGRVPGPAVHLLTGIYFKRRETAVYSIVLNGLRARGGTYRAFLNHAKVLLMANAATGHWLTVEGSANLISNPRTEQYVLTNDRGLYDFHRGWMDEAAARIKPEKTDDGQNTPQEDPAQDPPQEDPTETVEPGRRRPGRRPRPAAGAGRHAQKPGRRRKGRA